MYNVLRKKIQKKKNGFVLPMAIAILGVIIAISTILLSMSVNQNTSNTLQKENFERQNLCLQLEYDFISLEKNQFDEHMILLGGEKIINSNNQYNFKNKSYTLYLSEDYKTLELQNNKQKTILKIKVDNERKIIEKNKY